MPAIPPVEERIYKIGPIRRRIVYGTWIFNVALFSVPFAVLAWTRHNWALFALVILLAAGALAFFIEISGITRLVLTAEGVETRGLHGRKAGLSTPWKNIASIRLTPRGAEGLILKEPLSGRAAERLARFRGVTFNGAPLYDAEKRLLLGEMRYFPIEVFAHWIRHGDLWEQIRAHAPWLADAEGNAIGYSPRIPVEPWTWKKSAFVVGLISLSIGLVFLMSVLPRGAQAILAAGVSGIVGGCMGLYGLINVRSGIHDLRQKHFLEGGLWLTMGFFQLLFAVVIFGEMVGRKW